MKNVRYAAIAALLVIALLAGLAIYVTYPYAFIIKGRLERAGAANVIREADALVGKHPASEDGYSVLEAGEIPPSISKLKPSDAVVAQEGVYIRCGSFYAREWGVFILAPDSSFVPTTGTNPSFEKIADRVFLYRPKGWKYG